MVPKEEDRVAMRETVGSGRLVSAGEQTEDGGGRLVALVGVEDLMAARDDGDDDLVAYVESPNVTMIAPVSQRLVGIICLTGDELAHIAIVARELGVPCLVESQLAEPVEELRGARVWISRDGTITAERNHG
jgi:signal transduction protein with GAF and PtsI domain